MIMRQLAHLHLHLVLIKIAVMESVVIIVSIAVLHVALLQQQRSPRSGRLGDFTILR